MVLVEEIADDEEVQAKEVNVPAADAPKAKAEPALRRGFLEQAGESLYPPEGSPEGVVAPETHKAHTEHKMNENLNDQMNRGAKDNNGLEPPPWYTKEYPKGCQYNSPGCTLHDMETSAHGSELKKQMMRGSRWEEATGKGLTAMRLSFMSICDEDILDLVKLLKGNTDIVELDLAHNNIKDAGVQTLVGALANGSAPNLRELRLYSNEFGELGQTMLTKGLPVFRKKLQVHWKEPSWAHLTQPATTPAAGAPGAA
jgi:hypothetical protein